MPNPSLSDDAAGDAPPEVAPPPAETPVPEDWEKRFTYLYADFENYRRRVERERETLRRQTQADVLRGVLPLVEATDKAVEAVHSLPARDPVRRGVELLQRSIATFLGVHEVHPVAKAGEPFRADEHEAVAEAPPTESLPEGAVAEVVQQGYAFPGGLLRPAKVVVARSRPEAAPKAAGRAGGTDGPDAPENPP
ncbi:MAG: nucleotide exchange factor GrpE [Thermoplasmata archaeon]|nr:nucleotide exchange factor GrpE [Thermoplasmata archaeon]